MNRRLLRLVLSLLLVGCGFRGASAIAAQPLSDIMLDLEGAPLEVARDIANGQASGAGPVYQSTTANEAQSFEGLFTPADGSTQLAVFSDDGVNVFVNGVLVHGRFGMGQHLPALDQSFHIISPDGMGGSWTAGQVYQIRIDYSNTIYQGSWDTDGITLFAYEGGGSFVELQITPDFPLALFQGEGHQMDFTVSVYPPSASVDPADLVWESNCGTLSAATGMTVTWTQDDNYVSGAEGDAFIQVAFLAGPLVAAPAPRKKTTTIVYTGPREVVLFPGEEVTWLHGSGAGYLPFIGAPLIDALAARLNGVGNWIKVAAGTAPVAMPSNTDPASDILTSLDVTRDGVNFKYTLKAKAAAPLGKYDIWFVVGTGANRKFVVLHKVTIGKARLKINGTDDPVDDDYVIVSAAGGADRPSATLSIEIDGMAGAMKQVFLTKGGNGTFTLSNDSPMVTVGTPTEVTIHGDTASTAKDGAKISLALMMGGAADAEEDLTVIGKAKIFFAGRFQDRLPTDPDNVAPDSKRGRLGSTFALEGEPDLDKIIRFSAPVSARSHGGNISVVVTKVVAGEPAGVEFRGGDAVLGQAINLGPSSWFDGTMNGPGLEPISDFVFKVGTMFTGESTTNPKGGGLAEMGAAELTTRGIDKANHFKDRKDALQAAYNALPVADRAGTAAGRNLKFRIDKITANMAFYSQQLGFKVPYPGEIDKNLTVTPGASNVMKSFKAATKFKIEMAFFYWDSDLLEGAVEGTLEVK